jgi:hypothetical protein
MAYEPTVWKNRVVERPLTFNIVNNPDGTVTLVPAPGVIVESGTPVNAVNLNKLEQGLKTHEAETASKTELGHINLETFKTYKKIDQIVLGEEVAQLDVDLSGYSEIIVIGKNIKTTGLCKIHARINNISTSDMYSTSIVNKTTISNNPSTTVIEITTNNGYVSNSYFSSFEIKLNKLLNSTNGEFVFYNEQDGINGLCYGKFKCNFPNEAQSLNIFNSNIGSGYKFLVGSTFEIWGR